MLADSQIYGFSADDTCNRQQNDTQTSRLRQKLGHLLYKKSLPFNNNTLSSVIERDYLNGISPEQAEHLRKKGIYTNEETEIYPTDALMMYGSFDEHIEEAAWKKISNILCQHLRKQASKNRLEVFLPNNLLERVAKDCVRMSHCEPCGVRGCMVQVALEKRNGQLVDLGKVQTDSTAVPTFELHLTLVQDRKRWYCLRDLFLPMVIGCLNDKYEEVYLSPGYTLVKHKLYRQN